MRKVIVSIHVTLDGFISGPIGDLENLDWAFPGVEETMPDIEDFLRSVDIMLLGRIVYEGFASYWPDQTGRFADWMNKTPKIVFSKTPKKVEWGKWDNISLIHENVVEVVKKLKQQEGGDMVIFGGANLVQSFTNLGLIDEYRLIVDPVILGSGKALLKNVEKRYNLRLLDTKRYKSGAVVLHYQLKNGQEG